MQLASTRPSRALTQLVAAGRTGSTRWGRPWRRRGQAVSDPVVAEGALLGAAASSTRGGRSRRTGTPDAVAATVADVLWITTVPNSVRKIAPVGQTSRQAAWVQCLQTSEIISQRMGRWAVDEPRPAVDEGDVAPGVPTPSSPRVVIRVAAKDEPVLRDVVPLLAGHFAGLAADADAGVGEEPHARAARVLLGLDAVGPGIAQGSRASTSRPRRAVRPGTSQVAALPPVCARSGRA